ncbi:hypothetical protein LEP1GSC052_3376 [Leptospira kmetyi serovar Malaysia str. Bejo-Iso9]|nr:hypothetical protein LEP1GSC052_3376 [Leptospira kmetyi serovar Malaysia str. Bejo-Iso9]
MTEKCLHKSENRFSQATSQREIQREKTDESDSKILHP